MTYINKYAEVTYRQTLYLACRGVLRVKQAESSGMLEKVGANPLIKRLGKLSMAYLDATMKPENARTPEDMEAIRQYDVLSQHPTFGKALRGITKQRAKVINKNTNNVYGNNYGTVNAGNGNVRNRTSLKNSGNGAVAGRDLRGVATGGSTAVQDADVRGSINNANGKGALAAGGNANNTNNEGIMVGSGKQQVYQGQQAGFGDGGDGYYDDEYDDEYDEEEGGAGDDVDLAHVAGQLHTFPDGHGVLDTPDGPITLTPDQVQQYHQYHPEQAQQNGQANQNGQPQNGQPQPQNGQPQPQNGQPQPQNGQPGQPQRPYRLGRLIKHGPNKGKYLFIINGQEVIRDSKFATKEDYDAFVAQYQAEHPNEQVSSVDPTTGEVTSQDASGQTTVSNPDTGQNVAVVGGSGNANEDLVTTTDTGVTNGAVNSENTAHPNGPVNAADTLNNGNAATPPNTPPGGGGGGPTDDDYDAMGRTRDRNAFIDRFQRQANDNFNKEWSGAGIGAGILGGGAGFAAGDALSRYMGWDKDDSWSGKLKHWGSRLLGTGLGAVGSYYVGKGADRASRQKTIRDVGGRAYDRAVRRAARPAPAEPEGDRQLSLFGGYADEPEPTQVHRASYASRLVKKLRNQVGYRYYSK